MVDRNNLMILIGTILLLSFSITFSGKVCSFVALEGIGYPIGTEWMNVMNGNMKQSTVSLYDKMIKNLTSIVGVICIIIILYGAWKFIQEKQYCNDMNYAVLYHR